MLRSLPADLLARVATVTAETPDDVRLELAEGATVVWGSAEESALKSTVLGRLMQAAPPDTVGRYDVSAPLSPVMTTKVIGPLMLGPCSRRGDAWPSA